MRPFFPIEENKIYRGCLTDPSEERLLCDQETPNKTKKCVKCGESGCNNLPKIRKASLSCVHCEKSEECAFGQQKKKASPCQNDVPFGYQETCYTHYGKLKNNKFCAILKIQ